MRLGSSLRRRRSSGGSPPRIKKPGERKPRPRGRWSTTKKGIVAVGAITSAAIGSGVGYVSATQLVFPPPEGHEADYVQVPDLSGLAAADAERTLGGVGLLLGALDTINHPRVVDGAVVGQNPLPGQLALPGGVVGVTVSGGPERRSVPNVLRMRADRAMTVLETAGFQATVDSIETEFPAGTVFSTVPEPGVDRALPARVYLTVSLGPKQFRMPNLVGFDVERAYEVIQALGLRVGEVEEEFDFRFFSGPQVTAHTPPADSLVAPGADVGLVISSSSF